MRAMLGARFVIVTRILQGKKTVGYELATYNSGCIPTRKEQVQMLAAQGYITNATADMVNGELRLQGRQGTNL